MQVLIKLFERIYKNQVLVMALPFVTVLAMLIRHFYFYKSLDTDEKATPSDGTSYSAEKLNEWYDLLGTEGCQQYRSYVLWHLITWDPLVFFLCGTFLVGYGREAPRVKPQWIEAGVLFVIITVVADVINHIILMEGCMVYPEHLSDATIEIGSSSLCTTWIFLASVVILIFWWRCERNLSDPQLDRAGETEQLSGRARGGYSAV